MTDLHDQPKAVRHLAVGSSRFVVHIWRNAGGSYAASCLLGVQDRPTVDAHSPEAALSLLSSLIEGALEARRIQVRA